MVPQERQESARVPSQGNYKEIMNLQEYVLLFLTFCSTKVISLADELNEDEMDKRAPGWGKRGTNSLDYLQSVFNDLSKYELQNNEDNALGLDKRRPGWGKRSYAGQFNMEKRKPGWGKRAYDEEEFGSLDAKRAPGWGKRSSATTDGLLEEDSFVKRRPGWGKRSMLDDFGVDKRRPGWGKRAPGWGKRSEISKCQSLINDIRMTRLKFYQVSVYTNTGR